MKAHQKQFLAFNKASLSDFVGNGFVSRKSVRFIAYLRFIKHFFATEKYFIVFVFFSRRRSFVSFKY